MRPPDLEQERQMVEILVPLGFFAMIVAIFLGPSYLRSRERQKLQDTLRAAIDKGQPIPPEVIESMTAAAPLRGPSSPDRDLRRGIIWLGIAGGFAAMGWIIGQSEPDATYPMLGVAAFPAFIGLAFLVIALVSRRP
jgi:hypothetical protein